MKIVFLSFYNGEIERGVEVYTHELASRLTKLGHEVTVYQNGPKSNQNNYKAVSLNLKIDWTKKSHQSKRVIIPDYWAGLVGQFTRSALERIDNDVEILIATNGTLQSMYAKLWSLRHNAKLIVSGQSGPGWDDRWNMYMFPDTFVALTNTARAWAKRANPLVKVVTIPNGVDLKQFTNAGKKINFNFNVKPPIILSVGALIPIKRHDLTIKAVSKMEEGFLAIVGKGELEEELTKLAQETLPGRFKIMNMNHDQIPQVYRNSDLFVYPTSTSESFGIALLEAMASGLPIVATNDPIRREIIGEAGLFVDPTDTDNYKNTIHTALRKKWGNKPILQAEKFSWDKIAMEYEKLFNSLY